MGWSRISKVPKIATLQCLCSIRKKVKAEVEFCMQSFLKVHFNTLSIKVSYKVDIIIINGHNQVFSNHSQYQVPNTFAVSQKRSQEWRSFLATDKRQSFYKSVLSFLMGKQEVGNIFAIFLKKCCNCFVFCCDAKHSGILQGSSHACCYLFLTN